MKRISSLFHHRETALLVLLLCLFAAVAWRFPNAASAINLENLLRNNTEFALIALGMTAIIVSGGIDLSVGSMAGLASCAAGLCFQSGYGVFSGFAAGVLVGATCGALNGLLVTVGRMPPILVTLGTMMLYRGLATGFAGDDNIGGFPPASTGLGTGSLLWLPVQFWILALLLIPSVLLTGTTWGRGLHAVGANESAARLSGVPVWRTRFLAYLGTGILCGFSGILYASRFGSVRSDVGEGWELFVITCVIIGGASIFGGRGTLLGSLLGVALLAVCANGMTLLDIRQEWQTIIVGAMLILVVFINERLLAGRND